MEDYEKKYKEALERARQFSEKPYLEDSKGIVDYIFPEIKESEDERMKNAAIRACKYIIDNFENSTKDYEDAIAWLEKQGEQKPVVDDKDAEKASEEYRNFRMSCGIKDPVMLNEIEEAFYEGAIRKQKPVWSEEDETKLKSACALIRNTSLNGNEDVIDSTITFLKSLKGRVQPQREWSEEDEYCRNQLIVFCENCMQPDSGAIRCANWLKSLKERCTWKPSDNELEVLRLAAEKDGACLMGLYEQLKKLK